MRVGGPVELSKGLSLEVFLLGATASYLLASFLGQQGPSSIAFASGGQRQGPSSIACGVWKTNRLRLEDEAARGGG